MRVFIIYTSHIQSHTHTHLQHMNKDNKYTNDESFWKLLTDIFVEMIMISSFVSSSTRILSVNRRSCQIQICKGIKRDIDSKLWS